MKTRFRIKRGWFGRSKIVLQVGYQQMHWRAFYPFPSAEFVWRDATEEDFINRALGAPGPARSGADILLGRFNETPAPCPGEKAQDTSTEN